MKYTKKLLSLVLVLVLALALAVPGFAASITINPGDHPDGTPGEETYIAYKIFDAKYVGEVSGSASNTGDDITDIDDAQSGFGNISYTYTKAASGEDKLFSAIESFPEDKTEKAFTLTQVNNTNEYIVTVNDPNFSASDFAKHLMDTKVLTNGVGTGSYNEDTGSYTISGLTKGYYVITSSLGSNLVVATLGDITINTKNDYPTLTKKIEIANVTESEEPGQEPEVTYSYVDDTTADYGDEITFQITVTVPASATGEILVHDTLDSAMTYVANSLSGDSRITYQAPASSDGCTFEFSLPAALVEEQAGKDIVFTYKATLNGDATTATNLPNTAHLTYAKNYSSTPDTVNVKTFKMDVWKYHMVDKVKTGLADAGFVLMNEDGKYYQYEDGDVNWVQDIEDATEYTTAATGNYKITFAGLAAGTYTLHEKTVPTGYNPALDEGYTITDADLTGAAQVEVLNETGTVLPSTGGMGTTIFYTLGGVLVVGAAILLVTKKRVHDVEG